MALHRPHVVLFDCVFQVFVQAFGALQDHRLDAVRALVGYRVQIRPFGAWRHHRRQIRRQPVQVPVVRAAVSDVFLHYLAYALGEHLADVGFQVRARKYLLALAVDYVAVGVHHVVVFHKMLSHVEVVRFHFHLRVFNRFADDVVGDGFVLFHARPVHDGADAVAAESADDFVVKRHVELRGAGVALPPGAPSELVVDAPRLVALGADDVQAAGVQDALVILFPLSRRDAVDVGAAAQNDVRSAPRHVGGDSHRARLARLRHDERLALVLLGVQDFVGDSPPPERVAERLRLVDVRRSDQNGLPRAAALLYLADDRAVLGGLVFVNQIGQVFPNHRAVGGYRHYFQLVDFVEFLRFGGGGAGHAGQLFVEAEVVLERDCGVSDGLRANLRALFRLYRLMQPVRVAPPGHEPPGELIHYDNLAVLDDVIAVALENHLRLQRVFDVVDRLEFVVQVGDVQRALQLGYAVLGERRRLVLFVDGVVALRLQRWRDFGVSDIIARRHAGGPADDERRPRLVYKDVVHFVHYGVCPLALDAPLAVGRHVVAQVVESEFVVRPVGDVGGVRFAPGGGAHTLEPLFAVFVIGVVNQRALVLQRAHAHAQRVVHRAHPVGVAPREVVVDRYHMHAAPGQRVEIGGERGDERLALARFHLRDFALMQHNAADELDVVVALPQRAFRGFADGGERARQKRVQAFALAGRRRAPQVLGFYLEAVVLHLLEFRFKRVYLIHARAELGDDFLIRPDEHFDEFVEHLRSPFGLRFAARAARSTAAARVLGSVGIRDN